MIFGMTPGQLLQAAIIIFIMVTFGYLIWTARGANPVGTAVLQRDVTSLKTDVSGIKARLSSLDEGVASSRDVERIEGVLQEERANISKLFQSIARIDRDLSQIAQSQSANSSVVNGIAESLKAVTGDLKSHQGYVHEKLGELASVKVEVAANRAAIETIVKQLPSIRDTQGDMAQRVAKIDARSEATARQVEIIYQTIVPKGMQ
jgi:chromosome segregation ATPase